MPTRHQDQGGEDAERHGGEETVVARRASQIAAEKVAAAGKAAADTAAAAGKAVVDTAAAAGKVMAGAAAAAGKAVAETAAGVGGGKAGGETAAAAGGHTKPPASAAAVEAERALAAKALEKAVRRVSMQPTSNPKQPVDGQTRARAVTALSEAVQRAAAAGVDDSTLSDARRHLNNRMKSAENLVREGTREAARSRQRVAVTAIEAAAGSASKDRGAGLLMHVYRHHPPVRPSVALSDLEALAAAVAAGRTKPDDDAKAASNQDTADDAGWEMVGESREASRARIKAEAEAAAAGLKKALLKAQRDYHPDRNADTVRSSLGCSPEEWEVLSLAICQQLARVYDKLHKGPRR